MWPPTYLNCWVMVDTAFLCPVLLSMLLLYQTGSTIIWTLMPGGGFLRVINGTFNTAQHKNDPPAQQKPVGGVFGADQPGQIAPLVGVIPDGGVQNAAADCADGQLQSADARRADSRRRAQRQRTIRQQRQTPPVRNIVQCVVPRQANSSAAYAPPPSKNREARSSIQNPPAQAV